MSIKFLLINPTSPLWRINGSQRPKNSKFFRFSMLSSLYVAASMPDNVETKIVDEEVESIDLDTDADIIGISFMTYNAPRAYELGDYFRSKGKTVIFGGFHPTFKPEESIQHADAICIGESENNIPKIMEDYMAGTLKPFYKSDLVNLENLPEIDRRLIKHKSYLTTDALQATRGCFYKCDFCSVAAFNRYHFRARPVGKVIDELKKLGRQVLFMDDNIALNREYAKELFEAMIPLKKRWFSQCGIGIAEDDELLRLAEKSGCRGLFIGFESLSEKNLKNWNKHVNRRKNYAEITRRIHDHKIGIFAGFVFGSDDDGPDVFENTLDFLLDSNIEVLQSTRLTPFPGTPLYKKMVSDDRIVDKDWSHYDFFHVVHQPCNMSAETLDTGTAWLQKEFYSYKNISRRVIRTFNYLDTETVMKIILPMNLGYRVKLSAYGAFKLGRQFQIIRDNKIHPSKI